MTLSTTVFQLTVTAAARPAPTVPPIRECVEEDGSPKYQVIRFQTIAPSTPTAITVRPVTPVGGLITLLMVLATCWPMKAPSRFITAAMMSAALGVSARVETEVAIALAASWKPLVDSKPSEMKMTSSSSTDSELVFRPMSTARVTATRPTTRISAALP